MRFKKGYSLFIFYIHTNRIKESLQVAQQTKLTITEQQLNVQKELTKTSCTSVANQFTIV